MPQQRGVTVSPLISRARCRLTAHSNLGHKGPRYSKLIKEQDLIWSTLEDEKYTICKAHYLACETPIP